MPRTRPGTAQQKSAGKSIVWLASYPKSGNTWLRAFLANYLFDPKEPLPINEIRRLGASDASVSFYRAVADGAFAQSEPRESLRLRNSVLQRVVANGANVNLLKTHNARITVFGVNLIPPQLTRAAIYVVRDPRDVALSYARHFGRSLNHVIEALADENNTTAGRGDQVKQFLCSWSTHVETWTNCSDFPSVTLRYEDMVANPHETFTRALESMEIRVERERLERAVRHSSFKELRRQEEREPFVEGSTNSDHFFHTGTSGQWRDAMPADLANRICQDHGSVMKSFGYL